MVGDYIRIRGKEIGQQPEIESGAGLFSAELADCNGCYPGFFQMGTAVRTLLAVGEIGYSVLPAEGVRKVKGSNALTGIQRVRELFVDNQNIHSCVRRQYIATTPLRKVKSLP